MLLIVSQQTNKDFFRDTRDTLLLSNPMGIAISHFYYRYSLYPAEIIKPLENKTVKSVYINITHPGTQADWLRSKLINHDYFPVKKRTTADLIISFQNGSLLLSQSNKQILTSSDTEFFKQPKQVLREFSRLTDRYSFLRHFIYISLLSGPPILLYFFFQTLFYLLFRSVLPSPFSALAASTVCFGVGVFLLLNINQYKNIEVNPFSVKSGLT